MFSTTFRKCSLSNGNNVTWNAYPAILKQPLSIWVWSFPVIHCTYRHVQTCMHILLWILSTSLSSLLFSSVNKIHKTHHVLHMALWKQNLIYIFLYFTFSHKEHIGNPLRIYLEILPSYQRDSTPTTEWLHNASAYDCHNTHNTSTNRCSPIPRILALPTLWQSTSMSTCSCLLTGDFSSWRLMKEYIHF